MPSPLDMTVVIPLFNREHLIAETLDSVLGQTVPADAVIVVDDGSTDGSLDVVARFGDRVTLVRNGKQGVQAARNAGIALARTPWIGLCDSDDIWEPTWLERLAALRRAEPGIDLVFGNFREFRSESVRTSTKFDDAPPGFWDRAKRRILPEGWIFDACIAGEIFIWHPIFPSAMAFSKDLLTRAGLFDVSLAGKRNEDGEFTLRLLYHARPAAIPEALVMIRKHREGVSSDQLKLLIDEVWMLEFARRNHAEAQPYHCAIDGQIIRRSIDAANLAFAVHEHELVRNLLKTVPGKQRPMKLHLKYLVASLPNVVAHPVNQLLQRIAERV